MPRSSSGLGRWPLTPVTRVRVPYGVPTSQYAKHLRAGIRAPSPKLGRCFFCGAGTVLFLMSLLKSPSTNIRQKSLHQESQKLNLLNIIVPPGGPDFDRVISIGVLRTTPRLQDRPPINPHPTILRISQAASRKYRLCPPLATGCRTTGLISNLRI